MGNISSWFLHCLADFCAWQVLWWFSSYRKPLPTRIYLVIAYNVWVCLRWTSGMKKHQWKDLHELVPKVIECINHILHDLLPPVKCFASHSSIKITTKVVFGITSNVTVVGISPICLHSWDSGLGLWTLCSRDHIFLDFYIQCLQACELYRIIHNNNNLSFISCASFTTFPMSSPITKEYCSCCDVGGCHVGDVMWSSSICQVS